MSIPTSLNPAVEIAENRLTRRKHTRLDYRGVAEWDYFTASTGAKLGFIENLSEGGCLLRANESIGHRRWIRIILKNESKSLWFTCVGRVLHRQDRIEPWDEFQITLYRYGIQLTHSVNPLLLQQIRNATLF